VILNDLYYLLTDKRWFVGHIRKKYNCISKDQIVQLPITWGLKRLPLKDEVKLATLLLILLLIFFAMLVFTDGALADEFPILFKMNGKQFYSLSVPLVTLFCLGVYYKLRVKFSLRNNGIRLSERLYNNHIGISVDQLVLPPFIRQFSVQETLNNTPPFLNSITLNNSQIHQIDVKWYQYYTSVNDTSFRQNQIDAIEIKLNDGQVYILNSWAFPYSSLLYLFIKFNYPVNLEDIGTR
jgi:hypothetical protein